MSHRAEGKSLEDRCPRGCVDTDGCGCEWNAPKERPSLRAFARRLSVIARAWWCERVHDGEHDWEQVEGDSFVCRDCGVGGEAL